MVTPPTLIYLLAFGVFPPLNSFRVVRVHFVVASFEFIFFLLANMNKVCASTLDFHCCQLGVPGVSSAELG